MFKIGFIIVWVVVSLVSASENVTLPQGEEVHFLGKHPQLTLGILTGLTIMGVIFGFCCCTLLCYVCLKTQHQGPTVLQSLGNSLRRQQVNLLEAHGHQYHTRHIYDVPAAEVQTPPTAQASLTPKAQQPPRLPPRPAHQEPLPSTSQTAHSPGPAPRGPPKMTRKTTTSIPIPRHPPVVDFNPKWVWR